MQFSNSFNKKISLDGLAPRIKIRAWRATSSLLIALIAAIATHLIVRAAPTIFATMTATFVGVHDGDGKADPGETIEYTAVIQNSGADPATGVTFNDIIDLNTTLIAGSLNVSPLAANDTYATIGNTVLDGGAGAADPAVHVLGLLANDAEFLGVTFGDSVGQTKITSHTNPTHGTLVSFDNNTGAFTYLPDVGYNGPDTFQYTLTDAGGLTDTGTVTINVNVQRVWYVKNDAAAGDGRSSSPFDTLAEAQNASAANDTIYVFQGNGTTTGQNAGISLKSGQRLIGEGVALTVPVSVNGSANPTTLRAAGSQPQIDNTSGFGVSVSDSSNIQIFGLNIAGSTNAVNVTTTGANSGSFELANNTIRSAGANGIDVNGGGSGTLTVNLHDNTVTSTGNGIDIQRTAGNITIAAFDDNVVTGNTGGAGINIVGTGATILFDANPGTASFDTVLGGTTVIGQFGNGVGTSGLVMSNIRGDLSFTDLDVYSAGGVALSINGTTPNFLASGTGTRVTANTNTPTLSATGGPALDVQQANINLALSSLSSSSSPTTGVSLSTVGGTFSASSSGNTITNATGTDFSINGNSHANANVSVSYGGTITDDLGTLVQIQNVTAASTHSFTGAITDLNDGDGSGISLTNNGGATITFSGGLLLSTGANAAFTATSGGTVNVCDDNPCNPAATGSVVNTLTSTTGTALNVANTNIGSNNLEFRSISANGGMNGIILNTTGTSGGLKVKGNGGTCTGANCSGGTIANMTGGDNSSSTPTGTGIVLNNTANVSFTRMWIHDHSNYGIRGTEVDGFSLTNSLVSGVNGTNVATPFNDGSISFIGTPTTGYGLKGSVAFLDNEITGGAQRNVSIDNAMGTMNINFLRNNVHHTSAASGDDGFAIEVDTSAVMFANISDNIFTAHGGDHFNLSLVNNANANLTFKNNDMQGGHAIGLGQGVFILGATYNGTFKYDISNNGTDADPFIGNKQGGAIFVNKGSGTGVFSGQITNNVIGNPAVTGSGSEQAVGIHASARGAGGSHTTLISGNKVRQWFDRGIVLEAGEGSPTFVATVTNNTVSNPADPTVNSLHGVHFDFGILSGDNAQITVDVRNNLVGNAGAEGVGGVDFRMRTAGSNDTFIAGYSGGNSSANAQAFIDSQNPDGTTFSVTQAASGTYNNGPAVPLPTPNLPTLPPVALAPNSNYSFAHNQGETTLVALAQEASTSFDSANTFTAAFTSWRLSEQATESILPNPVVNASTGSGGKPLFTVQPVRAQSGETVAVPAFTLPAGKSVTIKFQVTVNGPSLPLGTTQISNQGTVESNELADVQTDDPSTGGGSDPTITPVDRPNTTVTSINRISSSPTNASSVSWTVTFADSVSGLTSSNFTLANSGLAGAPAITSVTAMGSTPATQWTITASTGTGEGTLGLNLTNDTGLSHDLTNLTFTGQVYTIDRTPPTVSMSSVALNPTNTSPIPVTVQFSETVNNFIAADIATGNATVGNFIAIDGDTYTFDLIPSGQGLTTADIGAGVATDTAGNDNTAATQFSRNFDSVAPTVSMSSPTSNPTNANPILVTVQFSENVAGFAVGDITPGNATVGNFIVVDGDTYTFDLTPSGQGLITADIAAGVATDTAGNGNTAATQFSRSFDNAGPTVTMSSAAPDPTNASPIPVTVQFSETVNTFIATDIVAGNATVDNFIDVDGDTYTFDLLPSGQGLVTADIAAGVAQDSGGNSNMAASQFARTFDSVGPTVTMSSAAPDPTNTSPIPVTVQFSKNVTGFDAGDITPGNATVGNFIAVDGDTYTFELTPSAPGLVTADIAADVATDTAANGNTAATQFSITFDSDAPTVAMTSAAPNPTNTSPIPLTVQFSESVTGFDMGDISPGNATVDNFIVVDGDTYTFDLTPSGDGLVTADIAAGVAQDGSGNLNSAASQFSRMLDTVAPTANIDQAAGQADPTSTSPLNFTIIFNEPVNGFGDSAGDVTLSGTADATTAVVAEIAPNDGTTYNVAVSGMTISGMVTASVPAGSALDTAGNSNTASTSTDNTVTFIADATPPSVSSVNRADPSPTSAASVNFTVTFSEYVTGVDLSDFTLTTTGISGATISNVSGSGDTYTITVDTGTDNGTIRLDVLDDDTILDGASNSLAGGFTSSQVYTIDKSATIDVSIGGTHQDQFVIPPQGSTQASFDGMNTGPVNIENTTGLPFLGAEQVIYEVNGTNTSFSETMGLPDSQLDTTYWFPWYNNKDLDTQLRFGNASSSTATVRVYIGGVEMNGSPFTLAPGANARKSFAGINKGPVKIESTQKIVVAERFIYKVNGIPTSFSETMGLPDSQLDTTYWFPWYNNKDLDTQLRFGNASSSTATVRVYIGGVEMNGSPFTLLPNQSKRVSFAGVNTGPVKIESTQNIVAAERVIYKISGTNTSLSEVMGLPEGQLDTTYWLPCYNNVDLDTQLRFGNTSGSTATVRVYIGGIEMSGSPFTLLPNQSIRVNFSGVNDGPVKIESNVSIVAAKRVIYKVNGLPTSFSEMMGLPESLLNAINWFPWYNNIDLDTQLRFVLP